MKMLIAECARGFFSGKKRALRKAPASALFLASGRREWDRTTDHHHVKVMLYH